MGKAQKAQKAHRKSGKKAVVPLLDVPHIVIPAVFKPSSVQLKYLFLFKLLSWNEEQLPPGFQRFLCES